MFSIRIQQWIKLNIEPNLSSSFEILIPCLTRNYEIDI